MNDTLGSNTKGAHRLRFSLLNLVLVMTVVAMALVIYRQQGKIKGLTQSVADAGFLSVSDRSQYHAIYVPTYDELTWRWRVWLPEGHRYQFSAVCNKEISDSLPISLATGEAVTFGREQGRPPGIPQGEYVVTVALKQADSPREWRIHYELRECTDNGVERTYSGKKAIPLNGGAWPTDQTLMGGSSVTGTGRRQFVSGTLGFFQLLCLQGVGGQHATTAEPPGLRVWVSPVPSSE